MRKLKNSELGRINVEEFKKTSKIPLIVVLDNIRSLNNIGSVMHSKGNYVSALEYYNKSLALSKISKDIYFESSILNNIGQLYSYEVLQI